MFYTVSEATGQIVEASWKCPDPQEQADVFGCAVYIIEGEHAGLSASPSQKQAIDNDGEIG